MLLCFHSKMLLVRITAYVDFQMWNVQKVVGVP